MNAGRQDGRDDHDEDGEEDLTACRWRLVRCGDYLGSDGNHNLGSCRKLMARTPQTRPSRRRVRRGSLFARGRL